jgi:protein-glutamine gamma-glutamyltransferase
MKAPPLLVGATLLFWGWQTGFLVVGIVMAAALESARWLKVRWEFSDDDFTRIWTFCTLLALAGVVLAFTANEGPSNFRNFFQNPSFSTQRGAGTASSQAAAAWIRWLPMILFLFVAAQAFSSRDGVPVETLSLILRWRWKRARKRGRPVPPGRSINVSYPYLVVCLFAASMHPAETGGFFWGLAAVLGWALWCQRCRRFSPVAWAAALAATIGLGYSAQRGVGVLQRLVENYNPQWFAHSVGGGADPLRSKTGLGHIGRLKGSNKIVIRLEPGPDQLPPELLREASYRSYKTQTWYSDTSEKDFFDVRETNNTTYVLVPGKTNTFAVSIACYLRGGVALLPLPPACGRLENLPNLISLQRNPLGDVLVQGPGLVIFQAHYGPGQTLDFPPDLTEDLAVPAREAAALEQVIAEHHLNASSLNQKLRKISALFQSQFAYSAWLGPGHLANTNETFLSRFLLRTRRGHCEYFATATVLLLRKLDIPARYAVGYAVHEAVGQKYVVRQRDAHAWCLVWNDTTGTWQDFDTTPASWVETESRRAAPLHFWSDAWSWIVFEFSKFRWGQTHLRQYILWGLVPVLLVLFVQILFQIRRRRQRRQRGPSSPAAPWPGLDSEFYRLQQTIEERGVVRAPAEPLSEWLRQVVKDPALADLRTQLQHLLRLHYRYRFDPHGLDEPGRDALRQEALACLATLQRRG